MTNKNQVAKIEGTALESSNPFAGQIAQAGNPPPTVAGNFMTAEMQRSIAEVQAQFYFAMTRPRNPMLAVDRMLGECQRSKLAEVAIYTFARGGTSITGLSIRALEMVARNWGNIRYGFRVLDRSNGRSSVQAYAIDLENNIPVERIFEVKHWRDTKQGGYPIKDERDIYELEANQAQRRVRACLEALIPGDVLDTVEEEIRATLTAKADLSPEGIKIMLTAFEKLGVNKAMIEARIQRKVEKIEASQKVSLATIRNSIKDGMSVVEDWFDMTLADKETKKSDLKDRIEEKKKAPEKAKPEKKDTPAPKETEEKQEDAPAQTEKEPEQPTTIERIEAELDKATDSEDAYDVWSVVYKDDLAAIKKNNPEAHAKLFEKYKAVCKKFTEERQ